MDRKFYDEYFDLERSHWWFIVRAQIIMDRIRKLANGRTDLKILNVGAGTGRTSELLVEFGEVTSIEYDQICADMVREKLGIQIEQGSITEIAYGDNQYDLVCSFDVVEHVEDDMLAVRELNRVCKPGGNVIITVPAFMSLWSHHDVVNHHFKRYTSKEIQALFEPNQGSEAYKTYFNSFLYPPIWLFRQLSNMLPKKWTRSGAGSDATVGQGRGFADSILKMIFSMERYWIRQGVRFGRGVSFMYVWKK